MKKTILLMLSIMSFGLLCAQEVKVFSDHFTTLKFYPNGKFQLETTDILFPGKGETHTNEGIWTDTPEGIRLNPHMPERTQYVEFNPIDSAVSDTLELLIDYSRTVYRDNQEIRKDKDDFEIITFFINGKSYNLVRSPVIQHCAFAPGIKNQLIVDESNSVRIPVKRIKKMKVMTTGFDKPRSIELTANQFSRAVISIDIHVDDEQTPRNRLVLVKGKNAYFYQMGGKPSIFLTPLQKIK